MAQFLEWGAAGLALALAIMTFAAGGGNPETLKAICIGCGIAWVAYVLIVIIVFPIGKRLF